MLAGGRSRRFLLAVALLAPGSLLATAPAVAAADVTVVDLPNEVCAQPRVLRIDGRTDDGHLVLDREGDPAGGYLGTSTQLIAAPGVSAQPLDQPVEGVVGNRLVQPVGTTPMSVTSRLVETTVP